MNTVTNTENINLKLKGMSCAGCANAIESAIIALPGVVECNVNFGTEQATVKYNPHNTSITDIQEAVKSAGYSAYSLESQDMMMGEDDREKEIRKAESQDLIRKIIVGGIISIILIIGSLPMMTGIKGNFNPVIIGREPTMRMMLIMLPTIILRIKSWDSALLIAFSRSSSPIIISWDWSK